MLEKFNIGEERDIDVLVLKILGKQGKNTEFQQIVVRDSDGVEAKINHFDNPLQYQCPVVLSLHIVVGEYMGNRTYTAKGVKESAGKIQDFLPQCRINIQKTYSNICKVLKRMRPSLSRIVCNVLQTNQAFKTSPLQTEGAYARPGGIMEATYRLMSLASTVGQMMHLDHDLMVAAACVLYVGYTDTVNELYEETSTAKLLGAEMLTVTKVANSIQALQAANTPDLNEGDTTLLLSILSNDKNAATFPEATAIRYLSNLVLNVEDQIEALVPIGDGEFINRHKSRSLYKREGGQNKA